MLIPHAIISWLRIMPKAPSFADVTINLDISPSETCVRESTQQYAAMLGNLDNSSRSLGRVQKLVAMLETHTTIDFSDGTDAPDAIDASNLRRQFDMAASSDSRVSADADVRISKICLDKDPSLDIQSLGFVRCSGISVHVATLLAALVALIGTDMAIFNCQLGVLHFSGGSRARLSAYCCLSNIVSHDTVALSISPSRNAVAPMSTSNGILTVK